MPSSLVVVALVLAWLVVLVPMIVRKRQEVAKTADSALAARVVRSGSAETEADLREDAEYGDGDTPGYEADRAGDETESAEVVHDGTSVDENVVHDVPEVAAHDADGEDMTARYYEADLHYATHYRPGRGGFDPEAAAIIARAKYAFRQRVVLAMLIGAVASAVVAGVAFPMVWWAHGAIDVVLVSYLVYLRRQVRIETEIRERRLARMQRVRRAQAAAAAAAARARQAEPAYVAPGEYTPVEEEPEAGYEEELYEPYDPERDHGPRERVADGPAVPLVTRAGAVLVEVDDEDPAFDELGEPGSLPYRRAVGE